MCYFGEKVINISSYLPRKVIDYSNVLLVMQCWATLLAAIEDIGGCKVGHILRHGANRLFSVVFPKL